MTLFDYIDKHPWATLIWMVLVLAMIEAWAAGKRGRKL